MELGKPLQWSACQLHDNKLRLKALFTKLDGGTSGLKDFSGPIGKNLVSCEKLQFVNFDAVDSPHSTVVDIRDLISDQKYLLDIWNAIKEGECSEDLSRKRPGKLSHTRWLTRMSRTLQTNIGIENPSFELRVLTYQSGQMTAFDRPKNKCFLIII